MISYSLHLSNKKHALTTTKKVAAASKHNLRQYESKDYCKDNIHVLTGGDNILDDLKEAYHQEFDACLDEYNQGKRSDRQIDDYLKYVSESGKNDVAAELIIQLGDAEFWHDKPPGMWRKMIPIFEEQIKYLGEMVPDFRIVSAVVHLDEKSPHAHIVGIPIGQGYKRGMKKQAAKTKVFTTESLHELQDKMHQKAEQDMEEHPEIFEGESLKEIEKGRNSDWTKEFYIRQKEKALEDLNSQYEALSASVEAAENTLEGFNEQAEETVQKLVEAEAQKEFMRYAFLEEPKSVIGKLVSGAWKKFKAWWDEKKRPEVEEKTRASVRDKLASFKKQSEEIKHDRPEPTKRRGMDIE